MIKLYIIESGSDYEGGSIDYIFSSKEKATNKFNEIVKLDNWTIENELNAYQYGRWMRLSEYKTDD